jgi:hypothetical protein
MARLVRRLHDHRLRHWDLAPGNLLVTGDGDGGPPSLALIDTESVTRVPRLCPAKRVFDLKSLKRLARHWDADCRRHFLKAYLGDGPGESWWRVWEFWRRW